MDDRCTFCFHALDAAAACDVCAKAATTTSPFGSSCATPATSTGLPDPAPPGPFSFATPSSTQQQEPAGTGFLTPAPASPFPSTFTPTHSSEPAAQGTGLFGQASAPATATSGPFSHPPTPRGPINTSPEFDGSVLAANEDGGRCEDDTTALQEDHGDDPKDASSDPESSEDSDDWQDGHRVVQFLAISANFPICKINGYDYAHGRCLYAPSKDEVQEDGMVDLVPFGPCEILMAYGQIGLEIFYKNTTPSDEGDVVSVDEGALCSVFPCIRVEWSVDDDEEIAEYTRTICAGPGRKLEITYLVIPAAVQTNVEVRLKLKDFGSRSHAVYGKIKATAIDYGNKSVHLFCCDRGRRLPICSGTTSILPLWPSKIALPCSRLLKLHIEVDLTVITTWDSHEEDENLKFSLEFTRGITSQERELDDDQVEVKIEHYSNY